MNILEPINRFKCRVQFNRLKKEILQGNIPEPYKATIELTMRCNLKCQMCFRDRGVTRELGTGEIKKLIEGLPKSINEIHLIGGEVFLRDDIFEILDYLSGRGLMFRIHTNGTLLDEDKITRLSKYQNLLGIGFSIDGTRELHNKIRGSKTAYDRTIASIEKAARVMRVSVNTVVMDDNFDQIEEVFNNIKGLGIEEYRIEPEMFCTQDEIDASNEPLISANIKDEASYGFSAGDLLALKKRLDTLSKDTDINVVIAPRTAELDAEAFITGDIRDKTKLFCKHLLVPRIDSEGNIIFCHIIKRRFGNLLETDFNAIWHSKNLEDFREKLLKQNLLPVCKRCCRLRSI